jgi:hypothetical protein
LGRARAHQPSDVASFGDFDRAALDSLIKGEERRRRRLARCNYRKEKQVAALNWSEDAISGVRRIARSGGLYLIRAKQRKLRCKSDAQKRPWEKSRSDSMIHENPPPVWKGSGYVRGTDESKFLAGNLWSIFLMWTQYPSARG